MAIMSQHVANLEFAHNDKAAAIDEEISHISTRLLCDCSILTDPVLPRPIPKACKIGSLEDGRLCGLIGVISPTALPR